MGVTRGLNYMAIFDEMQPDNGEDVWDLTARNIVRSVYFRPVWAGTKVPVEMIYSGTHYAEQAGRFDNELLKRHITHQSHDTVVLDYMGYYSDVLITTGRQHGKDYTLKKLADKLVSDEAYESMRYKTILPPWLYDYGVEVSGEEYMSGCIPYLPSPWSNREEKQEAFRRSYGLPDHSQIYGDPIEGDPTI